MENNNRNAALDYHQYPQPGKTEVVPTKPYSTSEDLALAYSPGVAYPCEEIERKPEYSYKYTNRGNLVAVISNGTAVLGLGDIGPAASKPVMEGKAMLFKIFAGLDCFDIEVKEKDPKKFIEHVKAISGTFGGINLEDIKAPECFEIENTLKAQCDIPVMHDDQHGTAIVSAAALINALRIQGKQISNVRMVVSGAGAAAIACAKLYIAMGMNPANIIMCDSRGVISTARNDLNEQKLQFAVETDKTTLEEALVDADIFLGLSKGGLLTKEMVRSMARKPIVFALANPDPEISYEDAKEARRDVIMATGRSDYPNQINNVLGFPYLFRAALDCRASDINQPMQIAAAYALAALARKPVPDELRRAYHNHDMAFGPDYIIPKPFDKRLLTSVSPAIAKAAVESGVAREPILDFRQYALHLSTLIESNDHYIIELLQSVGVA